MTNNETNVAYLPVVIDALLWILSRAKNRNYIHILHLLYLADRQEILTSPSLCSEICDTFIKTSDTTAAHTSVLRLAEGRSQNLEAQAIWDKYFEVINDSLRIKASAPARPKIGLDIPEHSLFNYIPHVVTKSSEYVITEISSTPHIGDEIKYIDIYGWHIPKSTKEERFEWSRLALIECHNSDAYEFHYPDSYFIS